MHIFDLIRILDDAIPASHAKSILRQHLKAEPEVEDAIHQAILSVFCFVEPNSTIIAQETQVAANDNVQS